MRYLILIVLICCSFETMAQDRETIFRDICGEVFGEPEKRLLDYKFQRFCESREFYNSQQTTLTVVS